MPRIDSLSILADPSGQDKLSEKYGPVIQNLQKKMISSMLKNVELSGDPTTGTVEAKRFQNAQSQAYGTARAAAAGDKITALPVVVPVDVDEELIEEVEEKDTRLYGVDNLINRRISNQGMAMERVLERAFFTQTVTDATSITYVGTDIEDYTEEIIQAIETTQNDYVDGVPRDMIDIVYSPSEYGKIRKFLDTIQNTNVDSTTEEFFSFHGVRVHSSTYLPATVDMVAMVRGSVAEPVMTTMAEAGKIQLSNAYGFGMFYSYGTKSVMPDLMYKHIIV
jgi:hypothetical protein